MSQLVLPHTIDAGTEITAVEHQENYVAIRDLINGNLEGGSGSSGNLKQDGVTAREMADTVLPNYAWSGAQAGVINSGDGKVTPSGGGLGLAYAVGGGLITDTTGIVTTLQGLVPAAWSGSTLTVGAAHATNPRIDQVIVTLTGWYTATVSILAGTATGGATLNNRTGAAALPSNSIRLADILVPALFAGPFVQNTHIRDRRPWVRGGHYSGKRTSGDIGPAAGLQEITGMQVRMECSGAPLEIIFEGSFFYVTGDQNFTFDVTMDGAIVQLVTQHVSTSNAGGTVGLYGVIIPSTGSHVFLPRWSSTNNVTLKANTTEPAYLTIREIVRPDTENAGA